MVDSSRSKKKLIFFEEKVYRLKRLKILRGCQVGGKYQYRGNELENMHFPFYYAALSLCHN